MGRKKNPIIIPLEVILDQCWTSEQHHHLYYAKIEDDIVIYCLFCKMYSPIVDSEYKKRDDKIRELKEKYEWMFKSKNEKE